MGQGKPGTSKNLRHPGPDYKDTIFPQFCKIANRTPTEKKTMPESMVFSYSLCFSFYL